MGGEELYILKHKDLDTAMVKINPFSGRIEYIHGGVSRNVVEDIANIELRLHFGNCG